MNKTIAKDANSSSKSLDAPSAADIGRLARSGAIWSLLMHAGNQILGLTSTMIVSRILLPEDFGLIAMVVTFTALLQTFSDFGLSWATIQTKNLSTAQVHNLFWLNAGVGLLLALGTVAASPLVADFYGRPELRLVTMVMSLSFIVAGIGAQPTALLKRHMRFKEFCFIVVGSSLLGTLASVTAALQGLEYWALVFQIMVAQVARMILVIWRSGYRPAPLVRGAGTLVLIRFGGYVAAAGVSLYAAKSFDNVIIGRALGSGDLGYYSRAYFIVTLPAFLASTVMTHVMVPSLSALKHDKEKLAKAYRKAVEASAALSFPMSLILALLAPAAVRLVYGEGWQPVVPLVVWMSIAGLFQPLYETAAWLFVSSGKGKAYFCWTAAGTICLIASFLVGVNWGIQGVAVASSIFWPLTMTIPSIIAAHKAAEIDLAPTVRTLHVPLAASLGMMVIVISAAKLFQLVNTHWLTEAVAVAILAGGIYSLLMARYWEPFPPAILSKVGLLSIRKEH